MTDELDAVVVTEREGHIPCPHCVGGTLKDVLDSRPSTIYGHGVIRRRRRCNVCNARTTTFEIIDRVFEQLYKHQSAKQRFAAQIVELIEGEVRTEVVRRLTGSADGTVITPWDEDIT